MMPDLYEFLFSQIDEFNVHLEHLTVLPNIMDGIDLVRRNGDVIAAVHSAVDGLTVTDSLGNTMATIHENVIGGTKIDFGMDHVINSLDNATGGETFYQFGEAVGYAQSSLDGIDFFSSTHEQMFNIGTDVFGHMDVASSISLDLPDIVDFSFSAVDHLDTLDVLDSIQTMHDSLDVLDTLDAIHSVTSRLFG